MHDCYASSDQVHAANSLGMNINCIGKIIIPVAILSLIMFCMFLVPSTHKNLILIHRFTLDNDMFIEFHPYLMRKVIRPAH
jgi:hypothetical protein